MDRDHLAQEMAYRRAEAARARRLAMGMVDQTYQNLLEYAAQQDAIAEDLARRLAGD